MPRHGGKHVVLVRGAEEAMRAFKMEIAADLGLQSKLGVGEDAFRNFSTVEVGTIGGEMVRRLQALGENVVKERYDKHEDRLLPIDMMPQIAMVRDVSNNGNPQGNISNTNTNPMVDKAKSDAKAETKSLTIAR